MAPAPHRNISSERLRCAPLAVAGLGAALLMTAGCGLGDGTPSASTSPRASAAASASADPLAEQKAKLLTAYRALWAAQVKAYSSGSLKNTGLESVAADQALSAIKVTALYYQDHGTVMQGQPKLSPKVTTISATNQPYTATVTDCIDSTHFVQVDAKTKKPVALRDSNRRHVATYHARTIGGKWTISDFVIDRYRTC